MSRPHWQHYESVLAEPIARYLALKRAMGCRFENEERALRLLDRYLARAPIGRLGEITPEQLDAFLADRPRSARSHNALLGIVRGLFDWLVDQQALAVSPLRARPQPQSERRLPFLYDAATIRRILACAAQLPERSRCPQRGPTYATIFAILATLGLRVGEASRLECRDVDLEREILLVRNSKFGKSRYVPFGPRLAERLRVYAALREQRLGAALPEAPFFSWNGRSPVATNSIRNTLRDHILPHLSLEVPAGTRAPCIHGLRHSFAVNTLLRWYRAGLDPQARLNHLSTLLGHTGPHSTAVYLTITAQLLASANERFEAFASPRRAGGAS